MGSLKDVEKEAEKKRIKIEREIDYNAPTVMADENLISRLIAQLFNNALKFTPESGTVKIRYFVEANEVRFEILDTGIGIAAENLQKIFDKFYQVDASNARVFGGLGLGLAICRQITTAHNGRIWAESEGLGKGSKFVFTLPIRG